MPPNSHSVSFFLCELRQEKKLSLAHTSVQPTQSINQTDSTEPINTKKKSRKEIMSDRTGNNFSGNDMDETDDIDDMFADEADDSSSFMGGSRDEEEEDDLSLSMSGSYSDSETNEDENGQADSDNEFPNGDSGDEEMRREKLRGTKSMMRRKSMPRREKIPRTISINAGEKMSLVPHLAVMPKEIANSEKPTGENRAIVLSFRGSLADLIKDKNSAKLVFKGDARKAFGKKVDVVEIAVTGFRNSMPVDVSIMGEHLPGQKIKDVANSNNDLVMLNLTRTLDKELLSEKVIYSEKDNKYYRHFSEKYPKHNSANLEEGIETRNCHHAGLKVENWATIPEDHPVLHTICEAQPNVAKQFYEKLTKRYAVTVDAKNLAVQKLRKCLAAADPSVNVDQLHLTFHRSDVSQATIDARESVHTSYWKDTHGLPVSSEGKISPSILHKEGEIQLRCNLKFRAKK